MTTFWQRNERFLEQLTLGLISLILDATDRCWCHSVGGFLCFFAEEMFFVKIPIPGGKKTSKSQVCLYMLCVFRA